MKVKTTVLPIAMMVLALSATDAYATESKNNDNHGMLNANIGINARMDTDKRTTDKDMEKKWNDDNNARDQRGFSDMGLFATVTAKTSTTITVKANNNGTIYTVDTTEASVRKQGEKNADMGDIAVGDSVFVRGDTTDKTIEAKSIISVNLPKNAVVKKNLTGVAGVVTAVTGDTITIKTKTDVVYTIDADDARIRTRDDKDAATTDIKVGDTVLAQGTIDNKSVDASVILAIDEDSIKDKEIKAEAKVGFFHKIGLFFKGLFKKN